MEAWGAGAGWGGWWRPAKAGRGCSGWFFIGLPLGRIRFEDEDILCVSGNAPAAKLLESQSVGSSIIMNGKNIPILGIT